LRIGVIGGTGADKPTLLSDVKENYVRTIFGDVIAYSGKLHGEEVVFLARHSSGHTVAPHRINYRANIAALKILGVERIIATAAVGSMNQTMPPGSFVIPDQFIDNTSNRPVQFFDEGEWAVTHLDMTAPYCTQIRKLLIDSCESLKVKHIDQGCYVCFQGPRYETPAEIKMFSSLGGDIAGMTHVPEVVLAREAEMCYGGIALVTDWGAGMTKQELHHTEVSEMMEYASTRLLEIIADTIRNMPHERTCRCGNALEEMVSWGRRRPDFSAR